MGTASRTVSVIGVGRCDRGDAAAGLLVADIVARRLGDQVVTGTPTSTAELAAMWGSHDTVVVVTAVRSDDRPGSVRRSEPLDHDQPVRHADLLHGIDLAGAVTLGRVHDRLPRVLVVYTIEGQRFTQRAGVFPEVAAAAHEVAGRIVAEVGAPAPLPALSRPEGQMAGTAQMT